MDIFFSHETALEYWRKHQQGVLAGASLKRTRPPKTPPDTEGIQRNTPQELSRPLHILVDNANARKASTEIVSHYRNGHFTRGSFYEAQEGYIVSSPELCFLQMASVLTFVELIKLAYEFCGRYVLNPESIQGFDKCKPLTTVAKLTAFTKSMKGAHGKKQALRVLKYTIDQAASPRETIVVLCLTLPHILGGFGLSAPTLNARIMPNRYARGTSSKRWYSCDLYWHDARLAVEYDSDTHHTGPKNIAADSMKRNTLSLMGINVISVTNEQIKSREETRKLAVTLSKGLGKKLRYKEPEFTKKCIELRKELFMRR